MQIRSLDADRFTNHGSAPEESRSRRPGIVVALKCRRIVERTPRRDD